jgi:hypothetical protein
MDPREYKQANVLSDVLAQVVVGLTTQTGYTWSQRIEQQLRDVQTVLAANRQYDLDKPTPNQRKQSS